MDKLTLRTLEDLAQLRKWLESRTYDDILKTGNYDPDSGIHNAVFVLSQQGERAGVVVVEDVSVFHKNGLRQIANAIKGGQSEHTP